MWNCVIVEDEQDNLESLSNLIQNTENLTLRGNATNVAAALELIIHHSPNLVFLDVMLGSATSFDLLAQLEEVNFEIIFTTGHSQFAIQAIKWGAFDYLLKPIGQKQFAQAIERLEQKKGLLPQSRYTLVKDLSTGASKRIALPETNGFSIVEIDTIVHIEAQGNYCDVFFQGGSKSTVTRKLREFEELLINYSFCRAHHSHLVNLNHIQKFSKKDGGIISLSNAQTVYLSRAYKSNFLNHLNTFKRI